MVEPLQYEFSLSSQRGELGFEVLLHGSWLSHSLCLDQGQGAETPRCPDCGLQGSPNPWVSGLAQPVTV